MKHLKTYETIENAKYKLGDYVYIDEKFFKKLFPKIDAARENFFTLLPKFGKIIDIAESPIKDMRGDYIPIVKYYIHSISHKFTILEDGIIRKLTPEEIQQFELELIASKYNL